MTSGTCPVCRAENSDLQREGNFTAVNCSSCGHFRITQSAQASYGSLTTKETEHLLQGVIRRASDLGSQVDLTTHNIPELIENANPPRDPFDALDRLLLWVHSRTRSFSATIKFSNSDYPAIFARDPREFAHLIKVGQELGWLDLISMGHLRLTLDGWKRVLELNRVGRRTNQAFVAMWFDTSMNSLYDEGIKPALVETGYDPVRIDILHHNNKIDDQIIAEIRRSGLLVADFTGNRGGVYFEAGFALGLGIPVIWMCRSDDLKNLHFDTRQYNHIEWTDPAEAYEKLKNRISASLGIVGTVSAVQPV
jgi:hypothetical protein